MKRRRMAAGLIPAGSLVLGLAAFTPVAHAGSTVTEPSDCSLTVPYHMTCTARPAGQQWQEVIFCNPAGQNGTDYFDYGTIVTGDGTSIAACALRNDDGYAAVSFSDAGLQPPGKQF
jgi:hypothetical protein